MRIRVRIRVRTRIAAILLCLLLALTLAGCVHADRTITFNSDGTGTYTYAIGLSAQMISLGGSTLTQSMDKFGEQIKQDGGTYSRYDDSGYTYWKYVRPFTSVTQLDTFLGQSPQNDSSSNTAANADSSDSVNVTEQPGFFATTFHVTGQMSLVLPDANQSVSDLLKDARLSVAITMPGWVSAQSGGNLNGNTVTYTVHFGESATIDVTGGGLNLPHIALITGGVLLALALFIVGLILLRRGNRPPVETAAYASTSPYYMPTQPGAEAPTFPATPAYPADDLTAPPPLPESTTPTPE